MAAVRIRGVTIHAICEGNPGKMAATVTARARNSGVLSEERETRPGMVEIHGCIQGFPAAIRRMTAAAGIPEGAGVRVPVARGTIIENQVFVFRR